MTPKQFCEKYLTNYIINSDGTVDVDGDVYLTEKLGKMTKLPLTFGKISGHFNCGWNNLTSLEYCPNYVGGYFNCYGNKLTSLEGGPKYVGASFWCDRNKLTSLEHCPKYVGIAFCCDIITHHILGNIQGNISCNNKQRIVI